ncbi:uncharacterized protein LOC116001020 [Ipomoea triloba]|uniref:uncharacterized protein LOC116001020 n=1 Tax=Ipomoea triloba TaxID=35885 RepID=UPI00125CDA0B|nr:uncharacterized protein LOC116001020 [Ipomoea triloba]
MKKLKGQFVSDPREKVLKRTKFRDFISSDQHDSYCSPRVLRANLRGKKEGCIHARITLSSQICCHGCLELHMLIALAKVMRLISLAKVNIPTICYVVFTLQLKTMEWKAKKQSLFIANSLPLNLPFCFTFSLH